MIGKVYGVFGIHDGLLVVQIDVVLHHDELILVSVTRFSDAQPQHATVTNATQHDESPCVHDKASDALFLLPPDVKALFRKNDDRFLGLNELKYELQRLYDHRL